MQVGTSNCTSRVLLKTPSTINRFTKKDATNTKRDH